MPAASQPRLGRIKRTIQSPTDISIHCSTAHPNKTPLSSSLWPRFHNIHITAPPRWRNKLHIPVAHLVPICPSLVFLAPVKPGVSRHPF
ncbi:unnamed protein product [Periconia digitata]|uniref:Uncharacterized protein n=1 Tax=Periconia digitata TaxID=1303443 RepID=A0A9W4XU51_9PLEO|nr:unnamed protein product [Periconia digitata]